MTAHKHTAHSRRNSLFMPREYINPAHMHECYKNTGHVQFYYNKDIHSRSMELQPIVQVTESRIAGITLSASREYQTTKVLEKTLCYSCHAVPSIPVQCKRCKAIFCSGCRICGKQYRCSSTKPEFTDWLKPKYSELRSTISPPADRGSSCR